MSYRRLHCSLNRPLPMSLQITLQRTLHRSWHQPPHRVLCRPFTPTVRRPFHGTTRCCRSQTRGSGGSTPSRAAWPPHASCPIRFAPTSAATAGQTWSTCRDRRNRSFGVRCARHSGACRPLLKWATLVATSYKDHTSYTSYTCFTCYKGHTCYACYKGHICNVC